MVVLVDKDDKMVGVMDKEKAHNGSGVLHRGFAVFVFNKKGELLVTRRSLFKRLWPGVWDNSCCSHPHEGDTLSYVKVGERRLKEELGFSCPLKFLGKFVYREQDGERGGEYEMCAILRGDYNGKIKADEREISEWRWVKWEKLREEMKKKPSCFTPWFRMAVERLKERVQSAKLRMV